jgi:large subunit ribosomal protein L35
MLLARFAPRLSSLVQRTTAQLPTATTLSPTLTLTTKRTIKTKSSAKKRFKVLGSGNIKRWKANKRQFNSKRNRKHIRQLGDSKLLQGYQVDLGRRLLGLK